MDGSGPGVGLTYVESGLGLLGENAEISLGLRSGLPTIRKAEKYRNR